MENIRGLGGCLITVSKGKETYTRVTDAGGYFHFDRLRPGKWIVFLRKENLPKLHEAEQDRIELDLQAGEHRRIEFKIFPKTRTIKMIKDGEIRPQVIKRK